MQLSQMYGLVSQRLNEGASGPTFYPTAEIIAALNEGQRCFCLLTLGLEKTAAWNVPQYDPAAPFFHMMSYFSDWIVPLRFTTASGMKVCPGGMAELIARDGQWPFRAGNPSRYCALGAALIGFDRSPANGNSVLQVTYARAPVALVGDTDVPEIPAEYHPRLVDYGVYRPRQVEGGLEFGKSLKYLNDFLDGAQHYGTYVRARNMGSRYDRVPFELEGFDRSALLKTRKDLLPQRKTPDT